jgi:2-keto-4-pentenoate hydratase/2-oxohepta-3-ene-1,7-dioic acid hydratase in catechol pathway
MDYETELVVVIKKKAFNISDDEALDHVLGYTGMSFIFVEPMALTRDS